MQPPIISIFDKPSGPASVDLDWRRMPPAPISTPCVKVCIVDGGNGLCLGCGRTLGEIAQWGALNEAERRAIMAQLPARLESAKAKLA